MADVLEFERLGPPPSVTFYGSVAIEPGNPQHVYFASRGAKPSGKAKGAGGLFQSRDGGESWDHRPEVAPSVNYGNVGVKVHPEHPEVVVAVCEYPPNFWISVDGGENWKGSRAPYKHGISIALDPRDPRVIYVGSDDGVWKTEDQGGSWESLTNGLPTITKAVSNTATDLLIDPKNPDTVYVGFLYAALDEPWGVYKSTDAGASWKACNSGLPEDSLEIDLSQGKLTNADGTKSNAKMRSPMLLKLQHRAIGCMAMDTVNPEILYVNTRQKGVFRTKDGGGSWENVSEDRFAQEHTEAGAKVMGILVHPEDPQLLVASTDRLSIFISRDRGDQWEHVGRLFEIEERDGKRICVLPNGEEIDADALEAPTTMGRLRLFTPVVDPTRGDSLLVSGDLGLFRVKVPGLPGN